MRAILIAVVMTISGTAAAHADPECAAVFDEIRNAVETDYVGFAMAIASDASRRAQYRADVTLGRAAASSASPTQCSVALQRFVESVNDPHVFLLERPALNEVESASYRAGAERIRLSRRAMLRQGS